MKFVHSLSCCLLVWCPAMAPLTFFILPCPINVTLNTGCSPGFLDHHSACSPLYTAPWLSPSFPVTSVSMCYTRVTSPTSQTVKTVQHQKLSELKQSICSLPPTNTHSIVPMLLMVSTACCEPTHPSPQLPGCLSTKSSSPSEMSVTCLWPSGLSPWPSLTQDIGSSHTCLPC